MRATALVAPIAAALALGLGAATARAQTYHHYQCADGARFDVAMYAGSPAAYLQLDGKSLALPRRFSLSSRRYAKNGIVLSIRRGGGASIKRAGKLSQCRLK